MSLIRCLLVAAVCAVGAPLLPSRAFAQAEGVRVANEFRIRAGDVLHVRVWPNDELGGEFPVEETGYVSLPILGQIRAAGRPLDDLRAEIRALYGRAIKNPVVTVTPEFPVAIVGAVQRPGLYPVKPTNTVADVIGLAGGLREDAIEGQVQLIRDGRTITFDSDEMMRSQAVASELALQSGDRIIVPVRKRGAFTLQNMAVLLQSGTFLLTIVSFLR